MPRKPAHAKESIVDLALRQFWVFGFHATSIDDLVRSTSVSRQGIYSAFGSKHGLFLACFDRYQETVVSPAFRVVEAERADLAAVAQYFDHQIARAEAAGMPGPGCFVANSATEAAPHDADVFAKVAEHNTRLEHGFANALRNSRSSTCAIAEPEVIGMAQMMAIFTNGFWTASRMSDNAADLRQSAQRFIKSVAEQLA